MNSHDTSDGFRSAAWADAARTEEAFRREQDILGRYWTLLGVTTDLSRDGDWIRSRLGGRSVFVQRFGDELVGFENVCVHRFYPLRTEDKGNGPIRCGFHHWQYNQEGVATGIPKCQQLFGKSPKEVDARLNRIDIATCGVLLFGRIPHPDHTESLEEYLGDGFAILQGMWNLSRPPRYIETPIEANWKVLYHITLDDYHVVAVHPDTFGKDGYLPMKEVCYYPVARHHSAYFWGTGENAVEEMAEACRNGTFSGGGYRIVQAFPNLLTNQFNVVGTMYVLLQQYVPLGPGRSVSRSWYAPSPFPPEDKGLMGNLKRRILALGSPFVLPFYVKKIFHEDNAICEGVQTVANQIEGYPILGKHEERIDWFERTYAEVVGRPAQG